MYWIYEKHERGGRVVRNRFFVSIGSEVFSSLLILDCDLGED